MQELRTCKNDRCDSYTVTLSDNCSECWEPTVPIGYTSSVDAPLNPRRELASSLAEGVRLALAAGDVEAARIAHETIGRLLAKEGR